jgi:3-mercaptopyruvate sulfurtransferase SseA
MKQKLLLAGAVAAGILIYFQWAGRAQNAQQPTAEKQSSAQTAAAKEPERIAVGDLKKKLDSGEKLILIDVREDWELKADGAIKGAIHIPVADLDSRMKDIPKDVQLIFY